MIRRANIDDAEAIAAVHVKSWQGGYAGIMDKEFLASLSVEQRLKKWQEMLEMAQKMFERSAQYIS